MSSVFDVLYVAARACRTAETGSPLLPGRRRCCCGGEALPGFRDTSFVLLPFELAGRGHLIFVLLKAVLERARKLRTLPLSSVSAVLKLCAGHCSARRGEGAKAARAVNCVDFRGDE
jgi:hypothetical protein